MSSDTAFKSIKVFGYDYNYLDSGAPPFTNYTTWVIVHGMGFNGVVLEKLLPRAHAHNLRIVSVYRRGYSPSSGFEESELKGIGPGKKFEEAEPFFRGQGTEIATFLVKYAAEQGIPLANPSNHTGGIVLIGWSLGAVHVLALLAYVDELPKDSRTTLQKYLHTILSHDAGAFVLGIPNTEKNDIRFWLEPDDRKRFESFFRWVTGHYKHKSVTSENIDDLEFNKPSDIPHSLHELSDKERAKYTNLEAFASAGCDGKLLFCDPSVFAVVAKRALFDKARAETFPNVRVRYTSGGTSPGAFVWAVWEFRKKLENPEALYGRGVEKARDVKLISQTEGGNHFIFWEDPEKAIKHYSASIDL